MEGSGSLFSCEVDGKPQPSVECAGSEDANEGVVLPLASSKPSPRGPPLPSDLPPGVYVCNATNTHGSSVKTVVVSAECERGPGGREGGGAPGCILPDLPPGCFAAPPYMDETTCPSHQTWLEGAWAAALACAARGRPSPRVHCLREGAPRLARTRVSREDAGTYRCEATNAHGRDSRTVTVGVECEWGQQGMDWTQSKAKGLLGMAEPTVAQGTSSRPRFVGGES